MNQKKGDGKSPPDVDGYLTATTLCQTGCEKTLFTEEFQAARLGNFEGTSFLRLSQLEQRGADNLK